MRPHPSCPRPLCLDPFALVVRDAKWSFSQITVELHSMLWNRTRRLAGQSRRHEFPLGFQLLQEHLKCSAVELPVAKTPLGTHFSYPSWLRERGQDMPLQRRGSSVVGIAHGHGYPLAHLPVQEQGRQIDGLRHPGPCRLDQVPQRLEQDLRIRNALLALRRNPFLLSTLLCHSRRLPHLLPKSSGG